MNTRHILMLVVLGALWGASYLFIRIASSEFGPVLLMDTRVLLAGSTMLFYTFIIRQPPHLRSRMWQFVKLGTINAALPFTLIAFAQLTLPASFAAILNATTPLFTALVAALWLKESLRGFQILGLMLGVIGVVILMGWSPLELSGTLVIAATASLSASLCYGIGMVYAKKAFKGVAPAHMSIGQLFGAGAVLLIPAATSIPESPPSNAAIVSVIMLAIMCTAAAYLIYFRLLDSIGPTKTSSVTFLVPIFATVWGVIFLDEVISAGLIVGLVMILTSVTLVLELNVMRFVKSYEVS